VGFFGFFGWVFLGGFFNANPDKNRKKIGYRNNADPAYHFDADPDRAFQFDADQDPDPQH
jgi:hypothetical protein